MKEKANTAGKDHPARPDSWHVARGDGKEGPYSTAQLQALIGAGVVRPTDRVLAEASTQWVAACEAPGLLGAWPPAPSPEVVPASPPAEAAAQPDTGFPSPPEGRAAEPASAAATPASPPRPARAKSRRIKFLVASTAAVLLAVETVVVAAMIFRPSPVPHVNSAAGDLAADSAAEALALNEKAVQMNRDGQYAAAAEVIEKSLEMYRRVYSPDKYPYGHPFLATSLCNMGQFLEARGESEKAEPFYREALEMRQRLYPTQQYPDGHAQLATSLNDMSCLFRGRGEYAKAEPYCRGALDMFKRVYPVAKYPDGNSELAIGLYNMGGLLQEQGRYGEAEPYIRDAVEMYKRLYPPEKYPDGHFYLAGSLVHLGALLEARGDFGKAEPYDREAVEMYKRLYPPAKFPDGHPDLAGSLAAVGMLLNRQGKYGEAEPYFRDALDMCRRLYPTAKYPDGHADLAGALARLGEVLEQRREYDKAEPYGREAVEMYKRLYPPAKYPDGHPSLAASLAGLETLLRDRGDLAAAEPICREELEMAKRLYPPAKYPDGHPELAKAHTNLGSLLLLRGDYDKAANAYAEGAAMFDRLAAAFADRAAEAETLNLYSSLPGARNLLLVASSHAENADPAAHYSVLWRVKAALERTLERRRRLLRATVAADEGVRKDSQGLIAVRQQLARLILASTAPGDDHARLLQSLTDQKERLERKLAGLLPAAGRESPPYTDLVSRLPDHAAFVDLYRYQDFYVKGRKGTVTRYAAFVLQKGRPAGRVELADGAAIEKDLASWRDDIAKGFRGDAAGRLRKSVWEPVAAILGEDADTVFVCPDGPLSALPWAALPGASNERVLLEDYTFAVVPSGLFLLEQLSRPADEGRGPGALLAIGGVRFDRVGTPADKAGKPWPALPATDRERAAVVAQVRKRPTPPEVVERSGPDADVARLVKDLPTARWAHLATHGFFAAAESKEREHLFRPDDFLIGVQGERRGAAARNPLTLSGLVLAGANQPTDADTGVLSGEAIAGLNLDDLDLAVLSACQTGLGEAAAGEGVFGLQRAFHIGGARNVVASLWKVDDEATAALMNLFYYHLWEKGEPSLEALHHAQLELYGHPRALSGLAKGRGAADWDDSVQLVTKPPADPKEAPKRPAAVRDWAAFVLSGAGR